MGMVFCIAVFLSVPAFAQAETPPATPVVSSGFDLANPTARCGDVLYFDYGSATDGPAYYTGTNGAVLCKVGGFCRGRTEECRACTQQYWHCDAPQPTLPEQQ